MKSLPVVLSALVAACLAVPPAAMAAEPTEITTVAKVPAEARSPLYLGNREPLAASPLIKLPPGSIEPRGWLRGQLELEAEGMIGRLPEVSEFCKFEGNAWVSRTGEGRHGWEEVPYWLKGYGDLGYVLKDQRITSETKKWVEGVLGSRQPDGWFGPKANKTSMGGQPDLWPHCVMLNVLQSYYEVTGDRRVLELMLAYFKWESTLPAKYFSQGPWGPVRYGDNIESIYWLYNRTGEAWLLDVARKIYLNMARWDQGIVNWHNVNIAQGFRAPGVYFTQSKDAQHYRAAVRNYETIMGMVGQFPGGGFAGDENVRRNVGDPRQGFETCGYIEFLHSFEMLTRISGEPVWADRCEDIAFNSVPATMPPDHKGLHYVTSANCIHLDFRPRKNYYTDAWCHTGFSPTLFRCCNHNASHGMPYYAEELWLATADCGLCASLYAASQVTAKVGDGTEVKLTAETDYPFRDTIAIKLATAQAVKFPLYLRVPGWCAAPVLKINGKEQVLPSRPGTYLVVTRTWNEGDTLALTLPMKLATRVWAKNQNTVSVDYGPLTFSLNIGERWKQVGGTEKWPNWEVYPTTPWNYGLEIDPQAPGATIQVKHKEGPLAKNPFTLEGVPIEAIAKARKIPGWKADASGALPLLKPSPARTSEPVEEVKLIPMGAARLRITAFPTVTTDGAGFGW